MISKIKINKYLLFIACILIINNFCFWLLEYNLVQKLQNISLILIWIFIFYILFKYRPKEKKKSLNFNKLIIFTLILAFTSSLQSYILYNQSIFMGLLPQRYFISAMFLYFPIKRLIEYNKIRSKDIKKLLIIIGIFELLIYFPQYFLNDKLIYLKAPISIRYGEVRLRTNSCAIDILVFFAVDNFFKTKSLKQAFKYIFLILLSLSYSIMVGKSRLGMIAFAISIVLGFILWKKSIFTKYFYYILFIAIFIFSFNTDIVKHTIVGLNEIRMNVEDISSEVGVRTIGRKFYRETVMEHPILGAGYINERWEPAYISSRANELIYWVDLGVDGFIYFNGFLGLIWIWFFITKIIKISIYLLKNKIYWFFMYVIYIITLSINSIGWYWYMQKSMVLVFLIILAEDTRKQIIINKNLINE